MRKLFSIVLGLAALVISGQASAACDANAGFAAAASSDCQGQAQGQLQGQAQGQLQGQQQGMQQGQIGINKNYNSDYNSNYNSNKAYGGSGYSKATAVQGQLQGNKQAANNTTTIKSDGSGNAVAAFAPSISSRSTARCVLTYSASGGGGGTGSIFSLGFALPIVDEGCVDEGLIRTGFESNSAASQAAAEEFYLHKMKLRMEEAGHITVAQVLDENGEAQKVMFNDDLKAFVPVEMHPKYQRAAAVAFADLALKAGYKPNISIANQSGFQKVSFGSGGGISEMILSDDIVESVMQDIDDTDRKDENAFVPRMQGDGN